MLSVAIFAVLVAHSINRYAEVYSGESSLPFEVLFQQKVVYDSFNSFRGGLADSYGRISLSPDGKSLMFYDLQINEPRTYDIQLDSGKYNLVDEGAIWAYGWKGKKLILAKEFNSQTQIPEGKIVLFDSSTGKKEESLMKESYQLTDEGKWGAVSFQISGDGDFYKSSFYSPNKKYYMKMRMKAVCVFDCSYSIEALEFFRTNGEKVGEYDLSESRVLSRTYFSDSWTPDNSFIVFDRSFAEPVVPTEYDSKYYPERWVGMGHMMSAPYFQLWTIKKIKMPN